MAEWVQKGWFLDFELIPPKFRPSPDYRFFWVKEQRITTIRDLATVVPANGVSEIDLSKVPPNYDNIITPVNKEMVFQCCYGIYPNVRTYLRHPVDYEVGELPHELPSDEFRVGMITQEDSPYDNPNLDKTEFWVIASIADKPRVVFVNPFSDEVTAYLKVVVNKLVCEPVTDKTAIEQLEKRVKPSTPVYLKCKVASQEV